MAVYSICQFKARLSSLKAYVINWMLINVDTAEIQIEPPTTTAGNRQLNRLASRTYGVVKLAKISRLLLRKGICH